MNKITKQKILELPKNVQERLIDLDIKWTKDGFNVNEDVNLDDLNLVHLPKFNIVNGSFYCSKNKLISLQGAPKKISGNFFCNYNQLTSLQGAPKEIGGSFWCQRNKLTSLQYSPKEINGSFWCYDNQLISLQGLNKIDGILYLTKDNLNPFTLIWVQKNYKVEFYE